MILYNYCLYFARAQKDPAGVAAAAFLYLLLSIFAGHESIPPARVYVKSQLPIGAGLGSSAAYSVALAAGVHAVQTRSNTFSFFFGLE
jgi:mevalonate kinase